MTKHRNLSAPAAWQRSGGAHDSTTPRGEAEREAIEEQRDHGIRRLDTEEDRRFWSAVDEAAREVESWPAWKRGGSVVDDGWVTFGDVETALLARFDRGAEEYGNKSYGLSVSRVVDEVMQEDCDVVGWAFFAWLKGRDPGTPDGRREAFRRFVRQAWHFTVYPPPERFTASTYALWCAARGLYGVRQAARFRRELAK